MEYGLDDGSGKDSCYLVIAASGSSFNLFRMLNLNSDQFNMPFDIRTERFVVESVLEST